VTIGEESFPLPEPFLVLATMNPIEAGRHLRLARAQVDRFMLKVLVTYPSETEERQIMALMARTAARPSLTAVLHPEDILAMRGLVDQVYVDEQVSDYIGPTGLHHARPVAARAPDEAVHPFRRLAARLDQPFPGRQGPRLPCKADHTSPPWTSKTIAPDVLRHRVLTTFAADADGVTPEEIVAHLLEQVPVP